MPSNTHPGKAGSGCLIAVGGLLLVLQGPGTAGGEKDLVIPFQDGGQDLDVARAVVDDQDSHVPNPSKNHIPTVADFTAIGSARRWRRGRERAKRKTREQDVLNVARTGHLPVPVKTVNAWHLSAPGY